MMTSLPSPVLILGACSDIAHALAHSYAAAGCDLILAARQKSRLDADCKDLVLRYGISVRAVECDLLSTDPDTFFGGLVETPRTAVMVAGLLGSQLRSASSDNDAKLIFETNYTAPARFLLAAARVMKPGSCIIGISSVAGDRGRGSNYIYGSAKAGFTAFLSGLRNSLACRGIHVVTVKPGFVATSMTRGMKLPPLLTTQPKDVAADILRAQKKMRNVLYTKWMWKPIMLIIRFIPEAIFKKLAL